MTKRVQYSYFVIRRPPSFNRSFFVIRIFVKPLDFPFSRPGFADSRRHLSSFGRHRLWATILSVISNSTFGNSLTPNRVHDLVAELCSSQCSRNPVKKRLFAYLQKAPPVVTAGYESNVRQRAEVWPWHSACEMGY